MLASEVGVLDIEPASIVQKGRLQPGRMFLVDTAQRRIVDDDDIKGELAAERPYGEWLHAGLIHLEDLPPRFFLTPQHATVVRQQREFGYTSEELKIIVGPMARTAAEPIGSMGTDTPIAVLSERPRLLFDYFTQLFAQVTNPPLDAIREELITSLGGTVGPEHNLLDPGPASCRQLGAALSDPGKRRSGQASLHQRGRRLPRLQALRRRRVVPGGRGWGRAASGARRHPQPHQRGDRRRRQGHHSLRPAFERRAGADPVAAADRLGPPSPGAGEDPHPGRAGRRDRRGPRGPSHGPAARLRRRRHQSLSGVRVDRGPHRPGAAHRRHQAARRCATSSRPAARACSRSCPRWGSRRWRPTPAPRSSRPSVCPRSWSTSTSPAP